MRNLFYYAPIWLWVLTIHLFLNTTTYAQIVSLKSGNWGDPNTWVGGIPPSAGADVIINHSVDISAATADAFIQDINSITITNTNASDANLYVIDGKALTVLTNISLTGTDADYNTSFEIYGNATNVTINGNLTCLDKNTFFKSVFVSVDDQASLTISGNFDFTKTDNPRPPTAGINSENFVEIEIGKTAGSTASVVVQGNTSMYYQYDDPGYFRLRMNNNAAFTTSNLLLDSDNSGFPDSTNVDLVIELLGSSLFTVNNTTTLDFSYDNVNPDHENIIDVNESGHFITKDIIMTSNASTGGTMNNMLRGFSSGVIDINGDITFVRVGTRDNRIILNDNSYLTLYGAINNSNEHSFQFLDNSTFEVAGIIPQTLPSPFPRDGIYQNLIINNSSGSSITFPGPASLYGTLTLFNGIVNTSSTNLLTIEVGGSSSTGNILSHIDGPISKVGATAFEFPVGDNGFWQPISISNIGVSTTFTAEYFEATPPNNLILKSPDPNGDLQNISGKEYWSLTTSLATSANVTLFWKDNVRSEIIVPADLRVAHYSGAEWENYGNIGFIDTPPIGSITSNNISTFGLFTFGAFANNPLPVDLILFSAKQQERVIQIEWRTSSENNSDHFILEKSTDGIQFNPIAKLNAKGNSKDISYYDYTDRFPTNGLQYYRLKQVDLNGTYEYSETILVSYFGQSIFEPMLYPNPVIEGYLLLTLPENEQLLSISYLDKGVKSIKALTVPGNDRDYRCIVSQLINGIYIIQIQTNKSTYTKKIIIE